MYTFGFLRLCRCYCMRCTLLNKFVYVCDLFYVLFYVTIPYVLCGCANPRESLTLLSVSQF
jgi:hypothetical protein